MECLFCGIAKRDVSSESIFEGEYSFAFLDIHPIAPGHTVVIPRIHAETILDLTDLDIGKLFQDVKRVTAGIQKALQPDGFTIGINHGKASGQTVDHLHVHVVPRFKNDGGGSVHSVVSNPPEDTLPVLAKKIKTALS
jgi:histidine triad (HIT) family protein